MSQPDRSWSQTVALTALACALCACRERPVASLSVPPASTQEFSGTARRLDAPLHSTDGGDDIHPRCIAAVHSVTPAAGDIELTVETANPTDRLVVGLCDESGVECALINRLFANGEGIALPNRHPATQQLWILPADCFVTQPEPAHPPVHYVVRLQPRARRQARAAVGQLSEPVDNEPPRR